MTVFPRYLKEKNPLQSMKTYQQTENHKRSLESNTNWK